MLGLWMSEQSSAMICRCTPLPELGAFIRLLPFNSSNKEEVRLPSSHMFSIHVFSSLNVLSYIPARASSKCAAAGVPGGPCAHCGATESPQWRRPLTKKIVLCNACGIYYSRHHSLPKRKKVRMSSHLQLRTLSRIFYWNPRLIQIDLTASFPLQTAGQKHNALEDDDDDEEEGNDAGEREEAEVYDFSSCEVGLKARHPRQTEAMDVDMLTHPKLLLPPMSSSGRSQQQQQRQPKESDRSHEYEAHYLDPTAVYSLALRGESASSAENEQGCDDDFDRPEALKSPNLSSLQLNSRPGSLPSSPAAGLSNQQRASSIFFQGTGSPSAAAPPAPPTTPKKRVDIHLDALFDANHDDSLAKRAMKRCANVAHNNHQHNQYNFSVLSAMMPPAAAPAALPRGSGPSSWAGTPPASPGFGAGSQAYASSMHRPAVTTSMAANSAGTLSLSSHMRPSNGTSSPSSHQRNQQLPVQPQQSSLNAAQLSQFMEALLKRSLSGPLLPISGATSLTTGESTPQP